MEALLTATDCCNRCDDDPVIENIPGNPGAPGAPGADGTDGANAYTRTTAVFDMPALNGDATISVVNTDWMVPRQGTVTGQIVNIEFAGRFEVRQILSTTQAVVRSIASEADGNAPVGLDIPSNSRVAPGGTQGPQGFAPGDALLRAQNLADLANVATARGNLQLKTAALADAGKNHNQVALINDAANLNPGEAIFANAVGIESKNAVDAQAALGLGSMATQNASAVTITGGSIHLSSPLGVESGGTGFDTLPELATALNVFGGYGLLGSLDNIGFANNNVDTPITMTVAKYRIDKVTVEWVNESLNGSYSLGLVTPAPSVEFVKATTSLNPVNAVNKFMDMPLEAIATGFIRTEPTLYARTGPTGTSASAKTKMRIFGWSYV